MDRFARAAACSSLLALAACAPADAWAAEPPQSDIVLGPTNQLLADGSEALADVNKGLELSPDSGLLHKSLEVVNQRREAAAHDRWRRPNKA